MKHARSDYDQRIQDTAELIPQDEPVFLLRGQDKFAYKTVQIYADLLEKDPGVPAEHVAAIRTQAMRMYEYQEARGSKTPDCPAGLLNVGGVKIGDDEILRH